MPVLNIYEGGRGPERRLLLNLQTWLSKWLRGTLYSCFEDSTRVPSLI